MAGRLLHLICLYYLGLLTASSGGVGVEWGRWAEEGGGGEVVVVVRGQQEVALPCFPSRPVAASLPSWFHQGKPLQLDSRRFSNYTHLLFKKVVHKKKWSLEVGEGTARGVVSDAGVYRCTVQTTAGALISSSVYLKIAGLAHEWRVSPENKTQEEGSLVRFECSIDSIPRASIRWLRDSQPLPQSHRYFITDSGILYISDLKQEDSGIYRCEGSNKQVKRSRLSLEGWLEVRPRGSSTSSSTRLDDSIPLAEAFFPDSPPSTLIVNQLNSTTLLCATPLYPASLTWLHTKPDGTNVTLHSTNNGLNILNISALSNFQDGKYSCFLKANKVSFRKTVKVVIYSPGVIVKKPVNAVLPLGKNLHLDCQVTGNPEPNVTWYKDGHKLIINGRIKQKRKGLILGTVEGGDTGVYQCEIEGIEWAAAHLVVSTALEQPKPPENLTCLPLSPTSIRVSWNQAPFLHPIQAFSVHFSPTDGGEEDNMPAALNTIEVSTLKPNTNYTFYVRSWGKKTASESSHKLICSTTDPDSLKWPRVSIRSIGTRCLFVEWSPPSSNSINVSYYQLQWKPANVSSIYFVTLPPYIHHYYITDLLPGGQYNVSVLSSVRADNVPWKSETLPQYIPNNPTTISVNLFNSTTVNVDWFDSSVSSNRLKLYYKKLPSGPEKQEFISSNLTHYVITQLESNSWYEVGLLPRGCPSLIHTAIGSGGALSKPHGLLAASPSPSRLSVSWSPVPLATSYSLTVTQRANASANCVYNIEEAHVEVGDVKSNTPYELRVRAFGPNGLSSPLSDNLLIHTMSSVGGGILNWRIINTTSVEITVRVTRYGQTQYSILYTKEPSAPGYAWQQKVVTSNNSLLILSGLTPGSTYIVRVAPLPMLGQNYSADINISLPLKGSSFDSNSDTSSFPKNPSGSDQNSDKILGILVGCAISACFIGLCSMTVLYKRRCFKNQPALAPSQENPSVPTPQSSEALSLTRLDAKSGYTNGPVNGLWRPLIGNGRVPNGHPYETTNLRITENPQYERRNEGDGGSRSTTDEGDSLLSGEEAGCADDSSCCLDKDLRSPDIHSTVQHCCTDLHEKPHSDDGFHETINIISSL